MTKFETILTRIKEKAALLELEQQQAKELLANEESGAPAENETLVNGNTAEYTIKYSIIPTVADIEDTPIAIGSAVRKLSGVERTIKLNEKQQQFLEAAVAGENVVVIGAAGTGKTTSVNKVTTALLELPTATTLIVGTKYIPAGGPGIVVVSYTRKAVSNIRKAVHPSLRKNTITLHKLLEFSPVFYEIEDPLNKGQFKKTMRFEPQRNSSNPLPAEIHTIIFEESSMIGIELYNQLQEAMPHLHQEIFLGDIQQLPPVFGQAVLGYKMQSLNVIELTEVYRQALNSPIINVAWSLLKGDASVFNSKKEIYTDPDTRKPRYKVPALDALSSITEWGTVKFQVWQKKLSADEAIGSLTQQFKKWWKDGYYDPNEDVILIPFNKDPGTVELDKSIKQILGVSREALVFEVVAGFNKHYLAVGDRVLYDKEDAFIVSIRRNGNYTGKPTATPSIHLNRWGHYDAPLTKEELASELDNEELSIEAVERFMEAAVVEADSRVVEASHSIGIVYAHSYDSYKVMQTDKYTDEEVEDEEGVEYLTKASEVNNLLGGNCITVHKFQGSENEKVFFIMTHHHAVMNQRELLYTAVTRASKVLHIICEPDTFEKGIRSQKIKGNTIAEKAEAFKGKQNNPAAVAELKYYEKVQQTLLDRYNERKEY